MQRLKLAFYIFLFLTLSLYSLAQNVSKRGTTAATFLQIPIGANATGMGGAFVSVANDATALVWNVGGIANLEQFEAQVSHTDWIADTKFDFLGVVLPLGEFGTLGMSLTSLSMDDMKVTTVEKPEGTGEYFSASDIAVGLSYARRLTDRFSLGITVKYIQQSIWHMSASAVAIDAGTFFKTSLFGGMVIGASISNFGSEMEMNGRDTRYYIRVDDTKMGSNDRIPTNIDLDSWDLPLYFQIGVSTDVLNEDNYKLKVALDAIHPNNDYQSMNVGFQFSVFNSVYLRGGYQSLFLEDAEGGLSFGLGVDSKMLFSDTVVRFDYSYRDHGRLENIHSFSLSFLY